MARCLLMGFPDTHTEGCCPEAGVCVQIPSLLRGWAGIHVGLGPGSDTVEQREGLCLAQRKGSGDAYGMIK